METETDQSNRVEPVLDEPVPDRDRWPGRPLGALRLPIAGPYRPWARLYRLPDGRLLWRVRLWEVDRAVARTVETEVLRTFARENRLPALLAAIDALVGRARARGEP